MCGIFGFTVKHDAPLTPRQLHNVLAQLFRLSESRGKEAAGLATLRGDTIRIFKSAVSASTMLASAEYAHVMRETFGPDRLSSDPEAPFCVIGHSRLETTGSHYENRNNQPVSRGAVVGIHNGIVVNHDGIWEANPNERRNSRLDTEALFMLLDRHCREQGTPAAAARRVFAAIEGTASIAALFAEFDILLLATNNGSLYRCETAGGEAVFFASERFILAQLMRKRSLRTLLRNCRISHIRPGCGCVIDLNTLQAVDFSLSSAEQAPEGQTARSRPRNLVALPALCETQVAVDAVHGRVGQSGPMDADTAAALKGVAGRFPHDSSWQDALGRCTRCILPETMPFIEFDSDGVCNYCRNYRRIETQSQDTLLELAERHRGSAGDPDCVIGVSGGRDSLYSLHYAKNVLKLNPVAYTYDWGMVTDLARRNISRICAKLGIEHIIVSADIIRKRRFIRQNVTAWLKQPALGMIPLFMAGDKQYYYYLYKVRRQLGVELSILGENMLERTDFKTGFAGLRPYNLDPAHVYTLPLVGQFRLAAYYLRHYLTNPGYINASILDTVASYASYYLQPPSYLNLYAYVPWEEDLIVSTLTEDYGFEIAPDSVTTWRIGDGTAAFYNYIYYNVAGFTENDTFRSNQVREGLISREDALARVRVENRPRFETIHWYLSIIGLKQDMDQVLQTIHRIPRQSARAGLRTRKKHCGESP